MIRAYYHHIDDAPTQDQTDILAAAAIDRMCAAAPGSETRQDWQRIARKYHVIDGRYRIVAPQ